jgi:hypothetical protein
MRRFFLITLLLGLCSVANLSAKDNQSKYKYAEVKHFTNAEAVGMPQALASKFYDLFRVRLVKDKVVTQTVDEGAAVPEADASDSIVVEGKFTEYKKPGYGRSNAGNVGYEIKIYRKNDHSLITTVSHVCIVGRAQTSPDLGVAIDSAYDASDQIKKALQ